MQPHYTEAVFNAPFRRRRCTISAVTMHHQRGHGAPFGTADSLCDDPKLVAHDPEKDLTRKRKLWPEWLIKILLGMGGKSLDQELLDHFQYAADTVSAPAFVQQRAKLRPEAMELLFRGFQYKPRKLYHGFRLLAMDGSDVQIPTDPSDPDSYFEGTRGQKPFNVTKIGALYDLMDRSYADAIVQGKNVANENKLLVEMADRAHFNTPTIVIADREYSGAGKPSVRKNGNRRSGVMETGIPVIWEPLPSRILLWLQSSGSRQIIRSDSCPAHIPPAWNGSSPDLRG